MHLIMDKKVKVVLFYLCKPRSVVNFPCYRYHND